MKEHLYQTPEGYTDVPFVYVFDGNGLTPGDSPENLIVSIQDDDFLLRSVAGLNQVAGTWQFFDDTQSLRMSGFWPTSNRWSIVPEIKFNAQSQIRFNLGTVALAANAAGNDIGIVGFQGVKRTVKGKFGWVEYESGYNYWERPYTYRLPVDVNYFLDNGAAPRQFGIEVTDADFELQAISIVRRDTPGALIADPFWITLFDPSGYNRLSDKPCSPRWFNYLQAGWGSAFPTPTMVYPVQSQIKVEIASLLNAAGGNQTFDINFIGVERMPCL